VGKAHTTVATSGRTKLRMVFIDPSLRNAVKYKTARLAGSPSRERAYFAPLFRLYSSGTVKIATEETERSNFLCLYEPADTLRIVKAPVFSDSFYRQ
jgi:hypothetical protein